ncbi:3-ketosteroid dehydrogenase [Chromatiales bacterium (ex Bugula neritina AB1)]|nr:3-ketosteroid dehydrogenase [Chromatiales bacterium (ex Bugula neritina AB1)]
MTTTIAAEGLDFDLSTRCVVVGAGACGLIAALTLADANIEALVLERDSAPTGSTSMSSGFIPAAGSRLQQSYGIEDSAVQFAADLNRKANSEADPDIVRTVSEHSGKVLDWLEKSHGLEWVLLQDFLYPGHTAHRMHAVPEKTGAGLHSRLLAACERASVTIATGARVDALVIKEANGIPVVSGVRVVRPDGSIEHIRTSAVILACNGYGANPQLMERFIPAMAGAHYHGHAGNTGDAVLWGEALEVPLIHTGAYQGHGSLAHGYNILITWALMMEGGIQVNSEGNRFSNEHTGYSEQAVHVLRQPGGHAYNVYDQRLHELGLSFPDYKEAFDAGAVKEADTIEQLALNLSVPGQNLAATLDEVTSLSIANDTDQFGRQFKAEQALYKPWYSIKVAPAVFHTQGGLQIDTGGRVQHKSGNSVPGLYAAGGAACGVSGATVAGYLSGNGLLTAVAFGNIAAATAIDELAPA